MKRFLLRIEYDGTPFIGWQRQEDGLSVQEALEIAVLRFCGEHATVTGAGRTDAGVHAIEQAAHVDLTKSVKPDTVRDALNAHLRPHPIAVLHAEEVADDFHARFSARARHYIYRIMDRRPPLALDLNRCWQVPRPIDADAMHEAAKVLLGRHDFTTFRAAMCQAKSPEKTLDRLDVSRVGAEVQLRASARSFLHHQVRSMTGSLKRVGEGKDDAGGLRHALEARDRSLCGPMAPPEGLYLLRVDY